MEFVVTRFDQRSEKIGFSHLISFITHSHLPSTIQESGYLISCHLTMNTKQVRHWLWWAGGWKIILVWTMH